MIMYSLTKAMGSTRLSDEPEEPEQLLFNPQSDSGIDETVLDNVPRYLFRLATPDSAGITNERWVCSEAVRQNAPSSMEDIFFNLNDEKRTEVAQVLDSHLWWRRKHNPDDNFVSWSSSLLFVLQYIYYRHYMDGTSLTHIKLYVVDTMNFPRGTFMRDLDLIDIFCNYDDGLRNLKSLRNRPDYYFGEYLSQGSLKIENKCQMITADVLFERNRLGRIQPHFTQLHQGKREQKPEWANEVRRLRRAIWSSTGSPSSSPTGLSDRMQAIQEILQNVAPDWKFPIAIYLAALVGPGTSKKGQETANDRSVESLSELDVPEEFRPWNFRVVAPDTTPELKQVKKLVREIHNYAIFKRLLNILEETEASESESSEGKPVSVTANSKSMQLAQTIARVLSKVCLAVVQMLSQELALVTSSEEDS